MKYCSVSDIAKKWNISERAVRNYCAQERIPGAFLTGKTWNIPEHAQKPTRIPRAKKHPVHYLTSSAMKWKIAHPEAFITRRRLT